MSNNLPLAQRMTGALGSAPFLRAGKALALAGYDLLCDQTFRAEVRAEFERSLA